MFCGSSAQLCEFSNAFLARSASLTTQQLALCRPCAVLFHVEAEMSSVDNGNARKRNQGERFDTDLYGDGETDPRAGYSTEVVEESDDSGSAGIGLPGKSKSRKTFGLKEAQEDTRMDESAEDDPLLAHGRRNQIATREQGKYQAQRLNAIISPPRVDPFAEGADKTPANSSNIRDYKDVMLETQLRKEERAVRLAAEKKLKEDAEQSAADGGAKKKRRWDDTNDSSSSAGAGSGKDEKQSKKPRSNWDDDASSSSGSGSGSASGKKSEWDATPTRGVSGDTGDSTPSSSSKPSRWGDATPTRASGKVSNWDQPTPLGGSGSGGTGQTPGRGKRSRWDETPDLQRATAAVGGLAGATPKGQQAVAGMQTPSAAQFAAMTPDQVRQVKRCAALRCPVAMRALLNTLHQSLFSTNRCSCCVLNECRCSSSVCSLSWTSAIDR